MKQGHFQAIGPICPLCRVSGRGESALKIGFTIRGHADSILEGALQCTNPECLCEYPIIDGIPLLVPQVRAYIAANLFWLTARQDLSPELLSMLGEGCGPGQGLDPMRQYVSTYAWDHYGEFDPEPTEEVNQAGSVARATHRAMELAGALPQGMGLDIGCSVGRATFELAGRMDGLVLGIDNHFGMVQLAQSALAGRVRYDLRELGLLYQRRDFAVHFDSCPRVDFWVADAMALPFPAGAFSATISMNVLDAVPSPVQMLREIKRALAHGGRMMLSTPYDWSGSVTPVEAWLGGHSPRALAGGHGPAILKSLLSPGAHPNSIEGLQLIADEEHFPWHTRLHQRGSVSYDLHIVAAAAT